jgi:hypothetical protein
MDEVAEELRASIRRNSSLPQRLASLKRAVANLLARKGLPTEAGRWAVHYETKEWRLMNSGEELLSGWFATCLPPDKFDPFSIKVSTADKNIAWHLYEILRGIDTIRTDLHENGLASAEAEAFGFFQFVQSYGDQLEEYYKWCGRKSRERSYFGGQERETSPEAEERKMRNARWRKRAADMKRGNRALSLQQIARYIAAEDKVNFRGVYAVLSGERGA